MRSGVVRGIRVGGLVALGVTLLGGAGCRPSEDEGARTAAAVTGAGTTDVTWSAPPASRSSGLLVLGCQPVAGTGRFVCPGAFGRCTATAIARNVVITAAHCFTDAVRAGGLDGPSYGGTLDGATVGFALPWVDAQGARRVSVVPAAPGRSVHVWAHEDRFAAVGSDSASAGVAAADLAVVVLSRPLSAAELPRPMQVYTGADLVYRMRNPAPGVPPFFQGPYEVTGFGSHSSLDATGAPVLVGQHAALSPRLSVLFGSQAFVHRARTDGTMPFIERGDSGGPFTFVQDGLQVTEIGVAARRLLYDAGEIEVLYSPLYDNGLGNGGFVRRFLEDADGDDVLDAYDNCPPSRCGADPSRCANPDQADVDVDGVGDVCDNCAPSRCVGRGLPGGACANADQADGDADGVGDLCDGCPSLADRTQPDPDGDGVTACDHCPSTPSGYRACRQDADCAPRAGETPGAVACALPPIFGRCADGSACTEDRGCPSGPCAEAGTWGRCPVQRDDADGDGFGRACDSCPELANAAVQSNANAAAESVRSAAALGDVCDPVPVAAVRAALLVEIDSDHHRRLAELRLAQVIGRSAPFEGHVAFLRCDCVTPSGEALDETTCRATLCAEDPLTSGGTRWVPVTVVEGRSAPAPAEPVALAARFDRNLSCDERAAYASEVEPCRAGVLRTLYWHYAHDVAAGRARSLGDAGDGPVTRGLIATVVPVLASGDDELSLPLFTSLRDAETGGGLRVSTAFVVTPSGFVRPRLDRPLDPRGLTGVAVLRAELRPGRISIPDGGDIDPLPWLRGTALLARTTDGALVGTDLLGLFRVPDTLSPAVGRVLGHRDLVLRPAVDLPRAGAPSALLVAAPRVWSAAFAAPLVVELGAEGLALRGGVDPVAPPQVEEDDGLIVTGVGRPAATEAPLRGPLGPVSEASAFVPADRVGAHALLSARERAVYLVGGVLADGADGEVWRYDLDASTWTPAFVPAQRPGAAEAPRPHEVLAATLDADAGALLVVDRAPDAGAAATPLRLLWLDLARGEARELARFGVRSPEVRLELATEASGRFLLVRGQGDANAHHVERFAVEAGRLRWLGRASGSGRALVGVHVTPDGRLQLPVVDRDGLRLDAPRFVPASRPAHL